MVDEGAFRCERFAAQLARNGVRAHILVNSALVNGDLILVLSSETTNLAGKRFLAGVAQRVDVEALPRLPPLPANITNIRFNMRRFLVLIPQVVVVETLFAVVALERLLRVGHVHGIVVAFDRVIRAEGKVFNVAAGKLAEKILPYFFVGDVFVREAVALLQMFLNPRLSQGLLTPVALNDLLRLLSHLK